MKIRKSRIISFIVIIFLQITISGYIIHAESYKYDALNRVSEVDCSSGEKIYYTYDAAGNIMSVKHDMPDLDSISVNKNDVLMKVKDTFSIKVTASSKDGKQTDVTKYAVYTSSDTNISDVSKDGVITAKKTGSSTITVKYYDKTSVVNVKVDTTIEYIWDSIVNFFKNLLGPIFRFFYP